MNPTIHIESQFPAQYLPLADWLHAFPIFQLATCRLHRKYKRFVLISLTFRDSSMLAPKMVYIIVCAITNSYANILSYSTHEALLMLDTNYFLDSSAPEQNCITRHLITLYHSALEH